MFPAHYTTGTTVYTVSKENKVTELTVKNYYFNLIGNCWVYSFNETEKRISDDYLFLKSQIPFAKN